MKRTILAAALLLTASVSFGQWAPAGDKIKSRWAKDVTPDNVLPEYPRPVMERTQWANLNGLWQYAIRPQGQAEPASFDGQILVPFAIESSLSGVQKEVGPDKELWYKRTFTVPAEWKGKNVMLNFGAVDWRCKVYLNGIAIGSHQGGYAPFSFDITPYLNAKGEQTLTLCVYDPTDTGYNPCGKQVLKPGGIMYTAVTGIWQTVWMEPVDKNHIASLKNTANVDGGTLDFTVTTSCPCKSGVLNVEVMEEGKVVASAKGAPGTCISVPVENAKLWSPDSPFLYDVRITLTDGGQTLDCVKSYAAMRKVSMKRCSDRFNRICINDKPVFNYGPLDQGWWPDGLYTAPTDEALLFDLVKTKEMGFNMIRKHVKVEPARWYYHCDKLGILVWQDMPGGDRRVNCPWDVSLKGGVDSNRSPESIENYYNEWKEIINLCISNPSVIVWVPFNESWGQFQTEKVAEFTKKTDPTRLVNSASGGNFRVCGDILDFHEYPAPRIRFFDDTRITVCGEYGGIGMAVEGHLWFSDRNWGYVQFKSKEEVTAEYVKYAGMMKSMAENGISGAVYTQTTDCEGEVNGLMTYDREVIKVDVDAVRKANQAAIEVVK